MEELHIRRLAANEFPDDVKRSGSLDLVAVAEGISLAGVGRIVSHQLDVVTTSLGMILKPVDRRGDAHRLEFVFLIAE